MTCKRCRKPLPIGAEKQCPWCGQRQDTFITSRSRDTKPGKTMSRASLLSMLSVFFVIVVVCIAIPMLRENNRKTDDARIEEKYAELAAAADKNSADWEDEVSIWAVAVENYKRSYPGDQEGIARHRDMLGVVLDKDVRTGMLADIQEKYDELRHSADKDSAEYAVHLAVLQAAIGRFMGQYPEDESAALFSDMLAALSPGASLPLGGADNGALDALERIEELIGTAKEDILDFETLNVLRNTDGETKISFRWHNRAALGVESITVTLTPLDSTGSPVLDNQSASMVKALRTTSYCGAGETKSSVFPRVWTDTRVVTVRLDEVRIAYGDGSALYLPPEVCHALWTPEVQGS